jgi:3-oxoacid CoA-transferase
MQISKILMSFIGPNKVLEEAYLTGQIAVELIPQGTLAERIACGGKGIPGFYTATGAGTLVETGGIAQKFAARKLTDKASVIVEIPGTPKEVKVFEDGKRYLLEPAIRGDVALIRAWKVDKAGNCIFRYTTRAFGGLMARAADLTVVEVRVEVNSASHLLRKESLDRLKKSSK